VAFGQVRALLVWIAETPFCQETAKRLSNGRHSDTQADYPDVAGRILTRRTLGGIQFDERKVHMGNQRLAASGEANE